jgi:putative ABC transport system substrate-binding protein
MNLRRKLLIGIGAGALAAPFAARAQAQRVYRVAVLVWGTERVMGARLAALRAALKQLGYVEGQNLSLSVRWNEGAVERLPDLAAELLRDQPDLVVAAPVLAAVAVHKLTRTVPIVMSGGSGAVQAGIAQSLARPGGNVTGVTNQGDELTPKQMELLKTMVPQISRIGVLTTGVSAAYDKTWHDAQLSAQALKLKLIEVRVGTPGELARLDSVCGKGACQALHVMLDPQFFNWRAQIIQNVARVRLPASYFAGEFAREGGLISYGTDGKELWRRAATYVDKILKGAKPGELPIEQPTKFELVVNQKTAKTLGIKVPDSILLRADEVIE